jgi:hypothetical protein
MDTIGRKTASHENGKKTARALAVLLLHLGVKSEEARTIGYHRGR